MRAKNDSLCVKLNCCKIVEIPTTRGIPSKGSAPAGFRLIRQPVNINYQIVKRNQNRTIFIA